MGGYPICYIQNKKHFGTVQELFIKNLSPHALKTLGSLAGTLKRRHRGCRVRVGMVLLQSHIDVIFQIELSLGVIRLGLEVHYQVVLDGKDGVNGKMWVVAGVDLVDDGGVVGMCDHKVNMGGTHG